MKTNEKFKIIRMIMISALISVILYIVLHEFGHVIVLWSVGAEITEFSVLGAHVSYQGGAWTDVSDRWMHLNGALLPVIVAAAGMLFYRKNSPNRFYRCIAFFSCVIPIASLLAWIAVPFLFMAGKAPDGDDIYKYLYNFTHYLPAWVVSLAAAFLMAGCIFLAYRKHIFQDYFAMVREIRKNITEADQTPRDR